MLDGVQADTAGNTNISDTTIIRCHPDDVHYSFFKRILNSKGYIFNPLVQRFPLIPRRAEQRNKLV